MFPPCSRGSNPNDGRASAARGASLAAVDNAACFGQLVDAGRSGLGPHFQGLANFVRGGPVGAAIVDEPKDQFPEIRRATCNVLGRCA
jgi:hypothetical protein